LLLSDIYFHCALTDIFHLILYVMAAISAAVPSADTNTSSELHHSDIKGRYLIATHELPKDYLLWQEMPIIVCTSHTSSDDMNGLVGDSIEEQIFSSLVSILPSEVCAMDLLLVLHCIRRIRLFGHQSHCWTLVQYLQHCGNESESSVLSTANNHSIHSTIPTNSTNGTVSPFQRRWLTYARLARCIHTQLQERLLNPSIHVDGAIHIDVSLIKRCFGILQLNAHRCAIWNETNAVSAATSSPNQPNASVIPVTSSESTASTSPARSKGLSMRLSMLEHSCIPNVQFTSAWVMKDQIPNALQFSNMTEEDALQSIGMVDGQMLCASSAHRTIGARDNDNMRTLLLSLRTLLPVSAGDNLSINYYPCHTRTVMRRAHLRNVHGFICQCNACEGRDPARTFHCCFPTLHPHKQSQLHRCAGMIAPTHMGLNPSDYHCNECHQSFTSETQVAEILRLEQQLRAGNKSDILKLITGLHMTSTCMNIPSTGYTFSLIPHSTHYLMPSSGII
jgi:hypothetical protein